MSFEMRAFEELMTNPTRTAIWSEIFRKPGITAKELIQTLNFKKTKMYYNLKEMLNSGLIEAEVITVKQSLNLKKYRISKEFEKVLKNPQVLIEKPRESKLFTLFTILALLKIEIRKTLNSTNDEILECILKTRKIKQLPRGIGVLFYSMDREQELLKDFSDFLETKLRKRLKNSIDSGTYEKTYGGFFFGFTAPE
ncbi:MAG: helix-turn-helix transcriptional regulator [Candidatus Heimdallarchaeota archaeon]|nr:MAG: helix-turn-helix transcriptional regulator [Candidatus Heimdallarchaeota archaeon]